MKIEREATASEKKLIASIDKEMQKPRLTKSVREAEASASRRVSEKSTPHAA